MGAVKSNRLRGLLAATALGLQMGLCAAQTAGPQPSQATDQSQITPTFRVDAHLAVTDVVVTDKRGIADSWADRKRLSRF